MQTSFAIDLPMPSSKKKRYRDVKCGECSRTFITHHPRKLFCDSCGIKRRRGRELAANVVNLRAKHPGLQTIALGRADSATSMPDAFSHKINYRWVAIIAIPFTLDSSKNRRWSNTGRGHVFLTKCVRQFEANLVANLRQSLRDIPVKHAKTWVSIFVQKPNHKSDAINTVDTICDAIKKAIGVDDRWFCIERVDWEIKKELCG